MFLRNLQTGLAVSRVAASTTAHVGSQGYQSKQVMSGSEREVKQESNTSSAIQRRKTGKSGFFDALRSTSSKHEVSLNVDAHSSETHLRHPQEHGTELSTFVSGGDGDSTSSTDIMKSDNRSRTHDPWGVDGIRKQRGGIAIPAGKIKVEKTVEIKNECTC
jgi:hypothetical protein